MTVTEPDAGALADYVVAAAAVTATIPGAQEWTIDPTGAGTTLPSQGARAVGGQVGEVTLLLITDTDLARQLQVGPPPADDLVEGCRPALTAAAAAIAPFHSGTLGDLAEVDATSAATPRDGLSIVTARLLEDGNHRATLMVVVPTAAATPGGEQAATFEEVPKTTRLASVPSGLELLHDVEMEVTAELGRARMLVREILELVPGSVIELDRAAGSPVDVLVNGTLIARGEVVVIDEEFGIRITEVVGHEEERSR